MRSGLLPGLILAGDGFSGNRPETRPVCDLDSETMGINNHGHGRREE